ncbi:hypothetical protein KSF78_0009321 [Schistosoma japonicum]|nr:hypothetical protein KSF78_0009321 [Schistosoma japonicum]
MNITLKMSYFKTTLSSKMTVDTTTLVNNIISIVQPIGVVIFIIGMVIMAICLLGIIGVCCRSKVCLAVVTSVLDSTISSWATNYVSIVSGDTDSVLFAALMIILNCCGSTSVTDITTSSKFSNTDTYSSTSYTLDSNLDLKDSTCSTTLSSTEQNDSTGCISVIQSNIIIYTDKIMYVSFGVLAFLVLLIVLASCVMAKH